ncbi:hypothetical protein GCM10011575_18130 [Microlunatus endophyticus]|uniref:PIN domain-containing protein n=2 Tax=Microlunatus endophyticus TaxID=1716077 RepID=A0A917S5C5_9ACTN|nr:hypothetical protein GCM10011575_18130 [Microlunatus endophyticus]
MVLSSGRYREMATSRLVGLGISGGACYDALIAETVLAAGGTLVTLDGRALRTYIKIGCPAEQLSR